MSNIIAVMHEGRIRQVGTPREIYGRPANRLACGDLLLRARVHPSTGMRRGDRVRVTFLPDRSVAIRPEGEAVSPAAAPPP